MFIYLKNNLSLTLCLLLIFFTGCDKSSEIKVYKKIKLHNGIYVGIMPIDDKNIFVKLHIKNSEFDNELLDMFKVFCDSFSYYENEIDFSIPEYWNNKLVNDAFSKYKYDLKSIHGSKILSISEIPIVNQKNDIAFISANVNRWRQQLGLNPISELNVESLLENRSSKFGKYKFIEIAIEK